LPALRALANGIRGIPDASIRAVGTNALRRARHVDSFLRAASRALGHQIEIINGREEARLVYMGVVRDMSRLSERRLVFDIGGGSTEIVLGVGDQPELLESANMGCVGFSEKFFPKGRLRRENFEKAILRARLEIRPLVPRFALARPDRVLGASGTMRSLGRILEMSGLGAGSLTCEGLQGLRRVFEEHGKLQNVELPGLSAERRPVLPGGLSIAIALCMDFDVDQIEIAQGALREGLLHDMAARWQKSDPREHTIGELVERFRVDEEQGERVAITALRLLELLGAAWDLSGAHYAQWLRWAARIARGRAGHRPSRLPQARRLHRRALRHAGLLAAGAGDPIGADRLAPAHAAAGALRPHRSWAAAERAAAGRAPAHRLPAASQPR
jgi:exopolyphosphatase/guanosine-5'-triphosphate,3'-diphosphate pyrophosphatase